MWILYSLQLNIHKFKCLSRFGLAHVVAANLCVWIRTLVKECTKEITLWRSRRGEGASEDFLILGAYSHSITQAEPSGWGCWQTNNELTKHARRHLQLL